MDIRSRKGHYLRAWWHRFQRRFRSTISQRRALLSLLVSLLAHYKEKIITGVLIILNLVLFIAILSLLPPPSNQPLNGATLVDYSVFVKDVEDGAIRVVVIQGNEIFGNTSYTSYASSIPVAQPTQSLPISFLGTATTNTADTSTLIYTYISPRQEAAFTTLCLHYHREVVVEPSPSTSPWQAFLWYVIPFILLLLAMLAFFHSLHNPYSSQSIDERITALTRRWTHRFERVTEGSRPQGEESNSSQNLPVPSVTFADVAGIDEVRAEVQELVDFLRSPEQFRRLNAHVPRGVLLVGPPGTGKTLLAKALAGEAHVPFFSVSGSEFVEMFAGVGARRVRELFQLARKSAPCIIFIDEIDAVGGKRSWLFSTNGEREQTLNQFLVELDGFHPRSTVIVLAATNRVDILDPALLRPGRFDRRVTLSLPDCAGREAILRVHTRHTPLDGSVDLGDLAHKTAGMSGADLANVVNEAALYAARCDLEALTPQCFAAALMRVQMGIRRHLLMSEEDKYRIALHESGHALVAHYLSIAGTVSYVTVLPYGQHPGGTLFTEEDHKHYSRAAIMARIAVKLGGRVAEETVLGTEKVTTLSEDDLREASVLARKMVTLWGMGTLYGSRQPVLIEREIMSILNEGKAMARTIVRKHHEQLIRCVTLLMEREQISGVELNQLL
jgi:ATP-dependent metalloprotease FtsH